MGLPANEISSDRRRKDGVNQILVLLLLLQKSLLSLLCQRLDDLLVDETLPVCDVHNHADHQNKDNHQLKHHQRWERYEKERCQRRCILKYEHNNPAGRPKEIVVAVVIMCKNNSCKNHVEQIHRRSEVEY